MKRKDGEQPAITEGLRRTRVAGKASPTQDMARGKTMAGEGETNGDFEAHRESYDRFMWWLKTGTIATAIVTGLVIFVITR
jgi:hypothetical protein